MNRRTEGGFDEFVLLADDRDPSSSPVRGPEPVDRLDLRLLGAQPSAGLALLQYALPEKGPVRLGLYRLDGSLVRVLVQGDSDAGVHQVCWDGNDSSGRRAPSGVYFARLSTPSGTGVRRILIVR